MTSMHDPIEVVISYVSDREIDMDGRMLIAEEIKTRLDFPSANVRLVRVEESFSPVVFVRNRALVTAVSAAVLDRAGSTLQQHPTLGIEVFTGAEEGERAGIAGERAEVIVEHLSSKWNIARERIILNSTTDMKRNALLKIKLAKE
jgi:hypothetical protein